MKHLATSLDPDYCVYILYGKDKKVYVGMTTDYNRRIKEHRKNPKNKTFFGTDEYTGLADFNAEKIADKLDYYDAVEKETLTIMQMRKDGYDVINAEHPEKVIEALLKHGGQNRHDLNPVYYNMIYFINDVDEICWTQLNEVLGKLLTTHPDWTEIFPEPEYKFKVGDKVKWPGSGIHKITAQKNLKGKPAYNLDHSIEVPEDALALYEEPQIKTWKDLQKADKFISGFTISSGTPKPAIYSPSNFIGKSLATSEKVAKVMLAMAQISQLMPYYGGEITDEEWEDEDVAAFVIKRVYDDIFFDYSFEDYHFLAFHTKEQRDDFYANNRQLVHDYLMID